MNINEVLPMNDFEKWLMQELQNVNTDYNKQRELCKSNPNTILPYLEGQAEAYMMSLGQYRLFKSLPEAFVEQVLDRQVKQVRAYKRSFQ